MKKKGKKTLIIIGFIILCTVCLSTNVLATEDSTIISVLTNFPDLFVENNLITSFFRSVGWAIVKLFVWVADACALLYSKSIGFIDFTQYIESSDMMDKLEVLFGAIMAVSICGLGIILIIDHEKKPKILPALFMIVISLALPSWLLATLQSPIQSAMNEIAGSGTIADEVVNTHLYDLLYIDSQCGGLTVLADGSFDLSTCHYPDNSFDIDRIEINEVLNYESERLSKDAKGKDGILGKKLTYYYAEDGSIVDALADVYNGFGWNSSDDNDFFNEFYYRYKVDYFPIYITLLCTCILYICISYKVVRIVIEIVTARIIAPLYSANLNGVQKTVKILQSIINGYIVLLLTSVLLKLYYLAERFISDTYGNGVVYYVFLAFITFAIIDGPNIIQQLTGIDAGLNSTVGKLIAAQHMVRGASHAVGGAANLARSHQMQKTQEGILNELRQQNGGNEKDDSNVPPDSKNTSSAKDNEQNSANQNHNPTEDSNLEKDGLSGEKTMNEKNPENSSSDMLDLSDSDKSGVSGASASEQMEQDWKQSQNDENDMNGVSGVTNDGPSDSQNDAWSKYANPQDLNELDLDTNDQNDIPKDTQTTADPGDISLENNSAETSDKEKDISKNMQENASLQDMDLNVDVTKNQGKNRPISRKENSFSDQKTINLEPSKKQTNTSTKKKK